MKLNKKIVFFDIDGTLVDHNKQIPDQTVEAIKQLKQQGVYVVIATGRAPFMFKDIREQLEIDSYVSFNGQYVVFEGETIYENPLEYQHLTELTNSSNASGHSLVYMNHKEMRASNNNDERVSESLKTLKRDYPEIDPQYYEKNAIYQVLLFCEQQSEDRYTREHQQLRFIRWHDLSCDVLPLGGSKAIGVDKLIAASGISHDQSYAFGDGLNDMEMLQHVGVGVAMGNAIFELKQVADYVTDDVDNEGLVKGLYEVGLLK
ncbi:Cof-type HAD-IIB family hydrolase [Radiobacillus sp. PE A8.2]|uniref:Cof-type HAD-IIB family hydrolase n=1 Tax=Radiobacillus sp. PE A8.2 TaxID=3380349 RepID=UPI0038910E5A